MEEVVGRKRSVWLVIWSVLIIIFSCYVLAGSVVTYALGVIFANAGAAGMIGPASGFSNLFSIFSLPQLWTIYLSGIVSLINMVLMVFMLLWKRWAFFAFVGTSLVALVAKIVAGTLLVGLGFVSTAGYIVLPLVLFLIIRKKWALLE